MSALQVVRLSRPGDESAMVRYYTANREHLAPWEPRRDEGYHSLEAWHYRLLDWEQDQRDGRAAYFLAVSASGEVLAACYLTHVVQGFFQACNMGYSVDCRHEGQGIMKATCQRAIAHAFGPLGLNRIMAAYLPRNSRSAGLLARLGFEVEGHARRYLKIDGRWEDHVLTALLNPSPRE